MGEAAVDTVVKLLENLDTGEKSAIEDAVKGFAKAVEERLRGVCRDVEVRIGECSFWDSSACEIIARCDDKEYTITAGISARATTLDVVGIVKHRGGFTRKVLEMLKSEQMRCISEGYCSGVISAEKLVKVAELVPEDNLEDRQNESPRFMDFVEVAKAEPRAKFEVYVVTYVREDERVAVEGALMPLDRADLIIQLLDKALKEPNECEIKRVCTPECAYYIRMWWD
jgi:hypothetical protein